MLYSKADLDLWRLELPLVKLAYRCSTSQSKWYASTLLVETLKTFSLTLHAISVSDFRCMWSWYNVLNILLLNDYEHSIAESLCGMCRLAAWAGFDHMLADYTFKPWWKIKEKFEYPSDKLVPKERVSRQMMSDLPSEVLWYVKLPVQRVADNRWKLH